MSFNLLESPFSKSMIKEMKREKKELSEKANSTKNLSKAYEYND